MDAATTVAVFSFLGVVVTAMAGAVVAIYTNRAEKKSTAVSAMEMTLRERILLRDEQIAELKVAKSKTEEKLAEQIAENIRLKAQLVERHRNED
jgi:hypothetical protein